MTSEPACVLCRRRPAVPAWRPFCSERCRLLDLARWIDGSYRIAGAPVPPPDGPDEHEDSSPDTDP